MKSQDYIHNFFDQHPYEEFINIEGDETNNPNIRLELYKKCYLYHFFLKYIRNHIITIAWPANFMRRILMALQMAIGIRRNFSLGKLSKGSNWVSITQPFADRLIELEDIVKKEFRYTHCCDEVYKQTIAINEGFTISPLGNMRYIDFKRGSRQSPYTFVESDFEELSKASALFARKFSSTASGNIFQILSNHFKTQ